MISFIPTASLRKMKKVYLTTPNISFAFNQDIEIDFVITENNELIAIEIKKTEKDIKQIRKFREKFKGKVKKAMIIDIEKEGIIEDMEIIPAWKFLLN